MRRCYPEPFPRTADMFPARKRQAAYFQLGDPEWQNKWKNAMSTDGGDVWAGSDPNLQSCETSLGGMRLPSPDLAVTLLALTGTNHLFPSLSPLSNPVHLHSAAPLGLPLALSPAAWSRALLCAPAPLSSPASPTLLF